MIAALLLVAPAGRKGKRRPDPRPKVSAADWPDYYALWLMNDRVSALAPRALRAGAPTPGVLRELAFETGRATLMRARAEPRAVSGWHHHGEHDVLGFVVRGAARFEFGPGGSEAVDVGEGGFFRVPAGLVHRDVNPMDVAQEIVLTLVGDGPLVVNVGRPE